MGDRAWGDDEIDWDRVDDCPPVKEYPTREIFAYGRYLRCQILNWEDGPPPKFIICHPLELPYREEFIARQGMGTWMRVDLREVLREIT